jgi:uncharacterized protein
VRGASGVTRRNFGPDREARLAVRTRHRDHLQRLHAAGGLAAAGPWSDDSGAMIVYRARDADAVQTMLAADPYMVEGEYLLRESTPIIGWSAR